MSPCVLCVDSQTRRGTAPMPMGWYGGQSEKGVHLTRRACHWAHIWAVEIVANSPALGQALPAFDQPRVYSAELVPNTSLRLASSCGFGPRSGGYRSDSCELRQCLGAAKRSLGTVSTDPMLIRFCEARCPPRFGLRLSHRRFAAAGCVFSGLREDLASCRPATSALPRAPRA